MTDKEHRRIIDRYPDIEGIQYQSPKTIPMAARKMNRYQSKQGMSIKRLQYLLSGVIRPLDVLGLEISKDTENENVQRYLYMLHDCPRLLLNLSNQMNELRVNLAYQAINPNYSSPSNSQTQYTISPADFQAGLAQQVSANQTVMSASKSRTRKRTFQPHTNQQASSSFPNPPQQFFRSGPSSQQSGYLNNGNNNTRHNNNADNNRQRNSKNPFRNQQ